MRGAAIGLPPIQHSLQKYTPGSQKVEMVASRLLVTFQQEYRASIMKLSFLYSELEMPSTNQPKLETK